MTWLSTEVERFARRILYDCLLEQTRAYWIRRAEAFDAVGTPACDEIARACRNRAEVSRLGGDAHELAELVREELVFNAGPQDG